jgi:hypothetical protein
VGPRDRPHLTPQRIPRPFAATPHSVTKRRVPLRRDAASSHRMTGYTARGSEGEQRGEPGLVGDEPAVPDDLFRSEEVMTSIVTVRLCGSIPITTGPADSSSMRCLLTISIWSCVAQ